MFEDEVVQKTHRPVFKLSKILPDILLQISIKSRGQGWVEEEEGRSRRASKLRGVWTQVEFMHKQSIIIASIEVLRRYIIP